MTGPSAEDIVAHARLVEAEQPTGRLALPSFVDWKTFPFEGDLRVKAITDTELPEPPRSGAGGIDCFSCSRSDDDCVWVDEDWRLAPPTEPTGVPVLLFLEPREHYDFGELPPRLVDSLGRTLCRVERALASLDNVGRVHMLRIGDGAEHLHFWFMTRPAGFVQGRGSFLALWDDILPPRPVDEWRTTLAAVRAAMESSAPST